MEQKRNDAERGGTERRFFVDFLAFRSAARRGFGFFPSEGGGKNPRNHPRRRSAKRSNERSETERESSMDWTSMSAPPFVWLWGDPAESLDRLRATRDRMEKADKEYRERERRRKARKIRKLLKAVKARQLKGQG